VVWLQAAEAFADLRLPLDGMAAEAESFAGTTSWHDPELRWSHQLDLATDGGIVDDRGVVSWNSADLVEAGTFVVGGRTVPYVEVWRRLEHADSAGPTLALTRLHSPGLLVRVGNHALTIVDDRQVGGTYRACYRTRAATADGRDPHSPDAWAMVLALGSAAGDLPVPPDASTLSPDDLVTVDGQQWQVLEVTSGFAGS
jgi:hypothetical protein